MKQKKMRTPKAQKVRRQALRWAKARGHDPVLVSHHGALAFYACRECNVSMEVWDSPSIMGGTMAVTICDGTNHNLWRRFIIRLMSF